MVLALGTQQGCTLTGKVEESGTERSPGSGGNVCKVQVVLGTAASEQGDAQTRERRRDREWGKGEAITMLQPGRLL